MVENIDGNDLLASGGHQWSWDGPAAVRKELVTAGVRGAWSYVTAVGARAGRVIGLGGRGPALLTATEASRAVADSTLDAIEGHIEGLVESGEAVAYEDDAAHTGVRLVLTSYRRLGPRIYGQVGAQVSAWQYYVLEVRDLDGGPL